MSLPTTAGFDVVVEQWVDLDRTRVQPGLVGEGGGPDVGLVGVGGAGSRSRRSRGRRGRPGVGSRPATRAWLSFNSRFRDDGEQVGVARVARRSRWAVHCTCEDAGLDRGERISDRARRVVLAMDAELDLTPATSAGKRSRNAEIVVPRSTTAPSRRWCRRARRPRHRRGPPPRRPVPRSPGRTGSRRRNARNRPSRGVLRIADT